MNTLVKTETKPMLLDFMAAKYGLRPQEFAETVRKTCGLPNATAEEFAAFLIVAREYDLNPILREIHAFPRRGGGIVPVVGVDGWLKLINRQPTCDGWEFDVHHDDDGELVAMTCRLYRKDRKHACEVTEYLSECIRATDPWKMKHRMLRHKTLMQAARYAFGFSGIYDEDEGERIAEVVDITPPTPPTPPKPPVRAVEPPKPPPQPAPNELRNAQVVEPTPEKIEAENEEFQEIVSGISEAAEPGFLAGNLLSTLDEEMEQADTAEEIEQVWNDYDPEAQLESMPGGDEFIGVALSIKRRHLSRVRQ